MDGPAVPATWLLAADAPLRFLGKETLVIKGNSYLVTTYAIDSPTGGDPGPAGFSQNTPQQTATSSAQQQKQTQTRPSRPDQQRLQKPPQQQPLSPPWSIAADDEPVPTIVGAKGLPECDDSDLPLVDLDLRCSSNDSGGEAKLNESVFSP